MHRRAKTEAAKAKLKACDELHERLDSKEGEKDLLSGEAEELSWEGAG